MQTSREGERERDLNFSVVLCSYAMTLLLLLLAPL
jgi:hypothetical protein